MNLIALIFFVIVVVIVFYAVYWTFSLLPFFTSIFFVLAVLFLYPKAVERTSKDPTFLYYSMFLTITLLLSLDFCKSVREFLVLLIVNVFICLLSLLYPTPALIIVSFFLNIYVVLRILTVYVFEEDCKKC